MLVTGKDLEDTWTNHQLKKADFFYLKSILKTPSNWVLRNLIHSQIQDILSEDFLKIAKEIVLSLSSEEMF